MAMSSGSTDVEYWGSATIIFSKMGLIRRGCEAEGRMEVVQDDIQCQDYMLGVFNLSVLVPVPERQTTYLSSSFSLSDDS